MKKRAQFPDSYTYTILLRGLSINAHFSGVLQKALSIYHSLSAPNSRVEPSIIHTNAALRVCARALDMDALWGVAAKIPETGAGAANATTYNTIINAIRQNMLLNPPIGESEEEQRPGKSAVSWRPGDCGKTSLASGETLIWSSMRSWCAQWEDFSL